MEPAIVEEAAWAVELNAAPYASGTATPELLDALAVGRLCAAGALREKAELLETAVDSRDDCFIIRVRVTDAAAERAWLERRAREECGGGVLRASSAANDRVAAAPVPPLGAFPELFRSLYAAAARSRESGGIHTAALCDGRTLLHQVEDVGRHSAVDKVLGLAFLAGSDMYRLGLLLSARVSAEIAAKAAVAGLAWVASRSIPTTLAVRIATVARLPIVARAPGKDAYVFDPRTGERPHV